MSKMKEMIINFFYKIGKKKIELPPDRYEVILDDIVKSKFIQDFETKVRQAIPIVDIGNEYGKNLQDEKCIGNYPLQTKLTKLQTIELTKKFFESIDITLGNQVQKIFEKQNPNVVLKTPSYDGTIEANVLMLYNGELLIVRVPIRGDVRDLYAMVHELTHTFDTANGDTITRKVLGEVAPQCMERMLDDFLLNMSQEDLLKYEINRETLLRDIQNRKITTFLSRVDNAIAFNKKVRQSNNKAIEDSRIDLRYVLAQVYQAKFMKYNSDIRKRKIINFIKVVEKDELDEANNVFEVNIKNPIQRQFYIIDSISEIATIVNPESEVKERNVQDIGYTVIMEKE